MTPEKLAAVRNAGDDLTKLNKKTGRNMKILLRFTRIYTKEITGRRSGKKDMSIVTAVLVGQGSRTYKNEGVASRFVYSCRNIVNKTFL